MRLLNPRKFCFLSEPDRYGRFGHQSFSLLASWCFAHRLNCSFLPNQYSYFAHKYNEFVDFSLSERAISDEVEVSRYMRLKGMPPDKAGNTKYLLSSPQTVNSFIADLREINRSTSGLVCLHLPFDQTAGVFLHSISTAMQRDLHKIFGRLIIRQDSSRKFKIAIHIRRGDVNPSSHPDWFIEDHYYINLIEALFKCYGETIEITILIQGLISLDQSDLAMKELASGNLRVSSTHEMWTNDNEIQDFAMMLKSDLVIAGQSSFSQLACLVKHGSIRVCIVSNEDSELPHPIDIDSFIVAGRDLSSFEQADRVVRSRLDHWIEVPIDMT